MGKETENRAQELNKLSKAPGPNQVAGDKCSQVLESSRAS